jgi:hypothetical protein
MQTENINCGQAREIDIVDYLKSIGITPTKANGNDYWYHSPLREEHTPSFKVNQKLNVWYDHGTGKGGNLVDLGILLHQCSVKEFLEKLSNYPAFSFHQQPNLQQIQSSKTATITTENKLLIQKIQSLSHPALCRYLIDRGIDAGIAKTYCHQIHYTNSGKSYYAIGFKNNAGGYELRAANFKSTIAPKDFTFLNTQNNTAIAVFEGFADFLSLLSAKENILPRQSNYLILNSLSFFHRARALMEQHEKVYLLLDNDAAGKNYTNMAMSLSPIYENLSSHYQNHKDLNEWLVNGSCQWTTEKEQVENNLIHTPEFKMKR